jgi:hypothetical protein
VQHGLSVWLAFPSASISKWSHDLGSSTSKLRSLHQIREAEQKIPEAGCFLSRSNWRYR